MGLTPSALYSHCRRLLIRYNAESRAQKFLDKGQLPVAPKHPLPEKLVKDRILSKEQLEDIHCKNKQLDDHLKKVYLTSTSTITGTPSKRPKPKKENEVLKKMLFYEPEEASPGHCTLTEIVNMIAHYQKTPDVTHSISALAINHKLDKKDVGNLLLYHSVFVLEKFDFMNAKVQEDTEEEPEKVQFEVFNKLEKKPVKQLGPGKE